ncbi:zinc finger and SCAN domain-containing 21-like isoform X1 [Labeo rohita]|uniref:Zinc finger and SCAN domain-containing 21-like isoform X1 n=1 Tax=Labeo rohita TaxID=84645 RepID=A0A498LLR6_LABRO|nr:zinc finger and SCAN domain-containing 21-like isoform X1 [Labeo rohita]
MMDRSENNFTFINQGPKIKTEFESNSETGTTCQVQQHITKHGLDDSGGSDASSDSNTINVRHIGSTRHEIQTFNLQLRNQEMLMQHRMELAQIRQSFDLHMFFFSVRVLLNLQNLNRKFSILYGLSYIASTTRPGWINKITLTHRAKLADEERRKAAAKARSLKHKQKVYGNPELHEAYRKKERERYQRRKSQGKVRFAKDLNPIELRMQQQKWRENSAAYRKKKAFQEVLVNIKEDIIEVIPEPAPSTSSAQPYGVF